MQALSGTRGPRGQRQPHLLEGPVQQGCVGAEAEKVVLRKSWKIPEVLGSNLQGK